MIKLLRRFKKLSSIDKARFIIFFPLLILAGVLDTLIDIGAFVYWFVIRWYRELLAITVVLLIIIVPTSIAVYIEETVPTFKGKTEYAAQMYVYTNCHEMCNNFIVAEDGRVRGFVRADDGNIDKILAVIARFDVKDKDDIIECLNEFRNSDYHSAVWLHNYCWTNLDGKVGYAVGLKEKYK